MPDRLNGSIVPATFAFEAQCWERCIRKTIFLNKVFRQREQGAYFDFLQSLDLDMYVAFVDILNSMRFGEMGPDAIRRLQQLSRNIRYDDGIMPTDLCVRQLLIFLISY